jgi:hypothetical protein
LPARNHTSGIWQAAVAGAALADGQWQMAKKVQPFMSTKPGRDGSNANVKFVIIRRARLEKGAAADRYMTLRGSWTMNPSMAAEFGSEGAARIVLRKGPGEIVARATVV